MITFKLNKREILESVPYTLEDVGGDFNKAAVDASLIELVEKNVITDDDVCDVDSYKRDAHIVKYYGTINETNKVIIVVNEAEETVEVEVN